ncbi:unnamed protein product [Cylicostephanus goldi]|uniref:Uncharacterized protein n=1 Tax=Cylicostephanus goldi TaxID=71465 RepID=A0A3P7QGE3_CYLGO|nr:unnamed protein product [Cylicostephanus goldi]
MVQAVDRHNQDHQARLDHQENQDHQAQMDPLVHLDQQVCPVAMEPTVLVHQDRALFFVKEVVPLPGDGLLRSTSRMFYGYFRELLLDCFLVDEIKDFQSLSSKYLKVLQKKGSVALYYP